MPPADQINSEIENGYIFNGCNPGTGYSIGWSLPQIIAENDPKSVSELFTQLLDVAEGLSSQFSGPIAFNSVDVLAAPLLENDPEKSVLSKAIVEFLSSIKENKLLVSLSIDLVPSDDLLGKLSVFQSKIDIFNEVLCSELWKMYQEGIFEPSILLNLHRDDVWSHKLLDKYLALSYRFGHPIIQNTLTSTITQEPTRPDAREIDLDIPYQRIGGPTGNADRTGVLGYVCVNMAKLAYDAQSEEDFFALLEEQIDEASRILEAHRMDFTSSISKETHPYALNSYVIDWLYSAIVVSGMNEGLEYLIDAPLGHVAGKAVTYKVLEFLRLKLEKIQYETGSLYTLEAFPCETHNDNMLKVSGLKTPYLTRGTELPHYHGSDLWDALEHQKKLQSLYTGATLVEIHVKDWLHYHYGCKLLTRRIIEQFGFSYLAVTPSLIQLSDGSDLDVIRVDGVLNQLDSLSKNYKEVHEKRVHYDVKNK